MKQFLLFLTVILLFIIVACSAQPVSTKDTKEADSTNMEYTIGLTSPGSANKNTDFTIEAKFTIKKIATYASVSLPLFKHRFKDP